MDLAGQIVLATRRSKGIGELRIHQESITIPENMDAIRAMMELKSDGAKSFEKTNKDIGLPNCYQAK